MEQMLSVHSQEKALYACAFFVKGRMKLLGKSRSIFAPLYIYPVNLLEENEVYFLQLESDNTIINPAFLTYLKTINPNLTISQNEFSEALPKGNLKFEEIIQLETTLTKLIPELDLGTLGNFPDLYDCLLYTSPSPRDRTRSRMPSSA